MTDRGGSGVWAELIGQDAAVATLRRAVAGEPHAMSHAWLVTGPPGSGRSNAARAFAAGLQCARGFGCGECNECRTSLSGAHPDVTLVRTELLSIGVDEVRELVRRAAMSPTLGRWQVIVVEDADRVTERGADALLKSIEEPAPRTVWILCAPTPRRRGGHHPVPLPAAAAADPERRRGGPAAADPGRDRAGAGGVRGPDRAGSRRPGPGAGPGRGGPEPPGGGATDSVAAEGARGVPDRRRAAGRGVFGRGRGGDRGASTARERGALEEALGFGTKGARPRQAQAALKDLEDQQKARAKRFQRDAIDRALTELTGFYRDVLSVQTGSGAELVNADLAAQIAVLARKSTPGVHAAPDRRAARLPDRAGGKRRSAAGGREHA